MNLSGAKKVWLRPDAAAALEEKALTNWISQTNAWSPSAEVASDKTETLRFELQRQGGGGQAGASGDLRHFTLAFREAQTGKFSIDSVRFVSEREEGLKEASGQQWAGLAE